MSTDPDRPRKPSATLKLAAQLPAQDVGPSNSPRMEHFSSSQDANIPRFSKRMTLGQRIAQSFSPDAKIPSFWNTFGEFNQAMDKAGDAVMRMTPLERMKRLYPSMRLQPLPETFPLRDVLGEPDVDVCLQYYRRFMAASESEGDEPVSILLEFLKRHPIEFSCSGWICAAVGYIVLGYPNMRNCAGRARKWFLHYWRDIESPKHAKNVQQSLQMFKACQKLNSPHAEHWKRAVKWMEKAAARGLAGTKWFDEYAESHPKTCPCVQERSFRALRKAYVKVARRYEDSPPPSAVVLEAVATEHRVSSRALAEFRADARKRTRNPQ